MDLASIDQPRAYTLCNYLTKERHKHLLTPSFPCFAQDAVIRNRVVQPVTQKPHIVEAFWDDAHQQTLQRQQVRNWSDCTSNSKKSDTNPERYAKFALSSHVI